MGKWVPPVPAEKLYGRDALALGSGLVMLLWCYDGVERDGSVKVDLMAVAAELETPYRTIKDWWKALRNGPFFASVKDRGKLGYVATFNRDWIEWRVMATNYPTMETSEGQNIALEPPLNEPEQVSNPVQGPVKAPSRTDEGQNIAPDLYIGTPVSQGSNDLVAPDGATPAPSEKKPTEPPTPASIRTLIADLCSIDLDGKTASRGQVTSLNTEAKKIWVSAKNAGKSEADCLEAIRYVAGWIKRTVYPYSNGQPLTPSAIRERWRAAIDAKPKTPYLNGHANGSTAPVLPAYDYDQELNPNSPEYRASLRGAR